jgi:hypothetical protein
MLMGQHVQSCSLDYTCLLVRPVHHLQSLTPEASRRKIQERKPIGLDKVVYFAYWYIGGLLRLPKEKINLPNPKRTPRASLPTDPQRRTGLYYLNITFIKYSGFGC